MVGWTCLIMKYRMVDYLEVEGTVKVCWRGATLHHLKGGMERRYGLKLIVAGIPDLFEKGSRSVAVGPLIDVVEKDHEFVSAMPGLVLCPMYIQCQAHPGH